MDLRGAVRFIIVFNDDFTVIDRLLSGRTDEVIVVAVICFPDADVGQHMLGIGNGDRIGVDIVTNDVADLAQRFAVDLAKQGQGFIGDIQRQLGLPRGARFFFPLNALNQQHDKPDTDATEDHRNTDFRDNIQPQFSGWRPEDHQDHRQRFAKHAA